MATRITDLDLLLGADKIVKLGGKRYTLPPDLPVELFLRINQAASEGLEDATMVNRLYEEILGLFRYKDPTIKSLPLSMGQLVGAIAAIYGDDTETDEQPAGPTTPSTRGASSKTKKPPRKRTASRSPNS